MADRTAAACAGQRPAPACPRAPCGSGEPASRPPGRRLRPPLARRHCRFPATPGSTAHTTGCSPPTPPFSAEPPTRGRSPTFHWSHGIHETGAPKGSTNPECFLPRIPVAGRGRAGTCPRREPVPPVRTVGVVRSRHRNLARCDVVWGAEGIVVRAESGLSHPGGSLRPGPARFLGALSPWGPASGTVGPASWCGTGRAGRPRAYGPAGCRRHPRDRAGRGRPPAGPGRRSRRPVRRGSPARGWGCPAAGGSGRRPGPGGRRRRSHEAVPPGCGGRTTLTRQADVRADGGYVVAPGTRTGQGVYRARTSAPSPSGRGTNSRVPVIW